HAQRHREHHDRCAATRQCRDAIQPRSVLDRRRRRCHQGPLRRLRHSLLIGGLSMLRHRLSCLLTAAAIAAFDGSASAQVVAGWSHETAGGVEFAYYTKGLAELTVRCKGSAVEVVYYVDAAAI